MVDENRPMHYTDKNKEVYLRFDSVEEISQLIGWDIIAPNLRPSRVRMLERAIFANLTN